ncbi:hypothetical protein BpHYR1_052439 [Brachionus plicatilis]|uniref:Uncharacterized protein n=1 Tax=Brachionus plicatilis TaxID=10195 RepID=A0A3M7QYV1_BRAPC|nr:hypothetical protein BpHYR1_052439 [Brachionus plicatilis]
MDLLLSCYRLSISQLNTIFLNPPISNSLVLKFATPFSTFWRRHCFLQPSLFHMSYRIFRILIIFTSLVSFCKYRFKDTPTASLVAVVVGVEEDACDASLHFIVLFESLTYAESSGRNRNSFKNGGNIGGFQIMSHYQPRTHLD